MFISLSNTEQGDRLSLANSIIAYSAAVAEEKGTLNKGWTGTDMSNSINSLTNGVAKRNEQSYFLPNNASEDDVEDWITAPEFKDTLPEVAGLTKEQAAITIKQGSLVSVGDGEYAIKQRGTSNFIKTLDGKTLRIKYPQ